MEPEAGGHNGKKRSSSDSCTSQEKRTRTDAFGPGGSRMLIGTPTAALDQVRTRPMEERCAVVPDNAPAAAPPHAPGLNSPITARAQARKVRRLTMVAWVPWANLAGSRD